VAGIAAQLNPYPGEQFLQRERLGQVVVRAQIQAGDLRRRVVYARSLQTLNDWVSISSFLLGVSILIFLINFVYSTVIAWVPEERRGTPGAPAAWSGRSPRRRHPAISPGFPWFCLIRMSTACRTLR
jgi:hypothetical protein